MSEKFVYPPVRGGMLDRLPDRLREKSNDNPHGYMMREAAQEIDRLRAENAMARVFFQAILDSGQRGYPADLAIEFLAKTAKTAKEGEPTAAASDPESQTRE